MCLASFVDFPILRVRFLVFVWAPRNGGSVYGGNCAPLRVRSEVDGHFPEDTTCDDGDAGLSALGSPEALADGEGPYKCD